MKTSIYTVIAVIILGGGVFLLDQQFNFLKQTPRELDSVTVRLSWVHQGQFAGFYVAKEKGFYEKEGLLVEFLELDQTSDQIEELKKREVDFSVMEAHQALVGIGEGADVKAIMAVYQINPHVLAARKDSGIAGPEDFGGKVIGLSGGEGEGNALFRIFVETYRNADSVVYKRLGFDSVEDFINNRADVIDLYRIDQPYLAEKRGIPLNIISLDAYGFSTYGDVVMVEEETIQNREDMVERFVRATRKGWEYAVANQEEAIAITLPYTSGDYNDVDYQRHIINQSVPLVRGSQRDFGRMEFVSWSTLYESMRQAGVFANDFDITNAYTNEFIK